MSAQQDDQLIYLNSQCNFYLFTGLDNKLTYIKYHLFQELLQTDSQEFYLSKRFDQLSTYEQYK